MSAAESQGLPSGAAPALARLATNGGVHRGVLHPHILILCGVAFPVFLQDNFLAALGNYLLQHQYGSTQAPDLWTALTGGRPALLCMPCVACCVARRALHAACLCTPCSACCLLVHAGQACVVCRAARALTAGNCAAGAPWLGDTTTFLASRLVCRHAWV